MSLVLRALAVIVFLGQCATANAAALDCKDQAVQHNITAQVQKLKVRSIGGIGNVEPGGKINSLTSLRTISASSGRLVCAGWLAVSFKRFAQSFQVRVVYQERAGSEPRVTVSVGR